MRNTVHITSKKDSSQNAYNNKDSTLIQGDTNTNMITTIGQKDDPQNQEGSTQNLNQLSKSNINRIPSTLLKYTNQNSFDNINDSSLNNPNQGLTFDENSTEQMIFQRHSNTPFE